MSAAARSVPREPEDDGWRVARAEAHALRLLVTALADVPIKRPSERRFVVEMQRADLEKIGPATKGRLQWLAWKYRRKLPRHLAPRLNPNDPIVKEMG